MLSLQRPLKGVFCTETLTYAQQPLWSWCAWADDHLGVALTAAITLPSRRGRTDKATATSHGHGSASGDELWVRPVVRGDVLESGGEWPW